MAQAHGFNPPPEFQVRLDSLPEMVKEAMERDAHLATLLRAWAVDGKIPADWSTTPRDVGNPNPAPYRSVDADVTDALAYALVGMVVNKQAMMAVRSTPRTLAEVERDHILAVLDRNGGSRQRTADALGIGIATLQRRLKQYRHRSAP